MPRANNDIVTEAFNLASARNGLLEFDDYQRLWQEMNANLVAQAIPEEHRRNLLTSIEMFAEPAWIGRASRPHLTQQRSA